MWVVECADSEKKRQPMKKAKPRRRLRLLAAIGRSGASIKITASTRALSNLSNLTDLHSIIMETVRWVSPAMLAMTRLLDRFSSVYTRGAQPYATELENIAQDWARQRLDQEGSDGSEHRRN